MPGSSKKFDQKKLILKKKNFNSTRDVTINNCAHSSFIHKKASEESTIKQEQSSDDEGIDYPIDIWFLISEYISPEDVGKFGAICKSTYTVIKSGKFWFSLYKRFYKAQVNLPERLKPDCMVRFHGLRACVIRSLHFMYFPYINESNKSSEPHSLIKRQCCLMWHKKGENRWYFFFKLKELTKREKIFKVKNTNNNYNQLDVYEDISENSEENCQVLRVACLKYAKIPLINGLILQSVKLELSPGFDHHRLHLNFGTSYIPKIPTQIVVLSGVVDCKVLNWWHRYYPHQDKDVNIFLPSTDVWDTSSYFDEFSSTSPNQL